MWQRKQWLVFLALLIIAAAFRIAVAHWLANDNPDDGRVYAQIARNVVEQHVYSQETGPPYDPTLIRAPGYPLFLAAIYAIFGHTNNGAIRIVQAFIDTGTCAFIGLLAFLWQPDERRKTITAFAALALAAVNPFTTIYAATILPEGPTTFLAVAMCAAATVALRAGSMKRSLRLWGVTGLLAGIAVLFRPDSGLFAAAIGLALIVKALSQLGAQWRNALLAGAIFSFACMLVLVPWTARNWRVFHLFQPLAPMHAEMPDEFVPRGYIRWLKTWIDDQQYIDPVWWELNVERIEIDDLPDSAFDSVEERNRVAALFDQYNHPPQTESPSAGTNETEEQPNPTPQPSPAQTPNQKKSAAAATLTPQSSPSNNMNSNTNAAEEIGDENDQNDHSSNQGDETDNGETAQSNQSNAEKLGPVKMTPEIDAAFGQIAAERIARHPLRYYLVTPAKRARALWFNTHSDFYPFEGALLPLDDLDYETHQHIWLPLFAALVGIYTMLGIAGGFVLWSSRDSYARIWLLLAALVILLRLALFSTVESPEPRYVVEFFPFLATLGGIAIARVFKVPET